MKKLMISAATAAFVLGLSVNPASAGWKEKCGAMIKELEERFTSVPYGAPQRGTFDNILNNAKQGLKNGKKKKCMKQAKKLKKIFDKKGV